MAPLAFSFLIFLCFILIMQAVRLESLRLKLPKRGSKHFEDFKKKIIKLSSEEFHVGYDGADLLNDFEINYGFIMTKTSYPQKRVKLIVTAEALNQAGKERIEELAKNLYNHAVKILSKE